SSGIGPIDPRKLEPYLTLSAIPPRKPSGAITKYDLMELIAESVVLDPANPQRVGIVASSIEATFFLNNVAVSTYKAATDEVKTTGSPTNQVSSVDFDPTTGQLTANWANAIDIHHTKATFAFGYGPYLSDHYATVELLDPNDPAQPITFTDDVGTDNTNLVAGMKMTTTSQFSQPMSLYYSGDDGSKTVVIQSPIPLQPFNAGLLNFGRFYPMQEGTPEGSWNAYAYYFHNGVNGQDVPTIDGRGYAFPFDDNGGYSSDLDVDFQSGEAVTVSLTLNEVVDPAG
ncbi:MAG: hypothetical protein AAGB22_12675, partial [Bacteroidota bacterium]